MFVPGCTVRWILTGVSSEGLTAAHINLQMPAHIRHQKNLVLCCPLLKHRPWLVSQQSAPFISLCRAKEPVLTQEIKGFAALTYG